VPVCYYREYCDICIVMDSLRWIWYPEINNHRQSRWYEEGP